MVDAGMRALSDGLLKQQEILSRLADSQERLESCIAEVAQDRRADALLREATGPSQSQPEHSSPLLQEIKSRELRSCASQGSAARESPSRSSRERSTEARHDVSGSQSRDLAFGVHRWGCRVVSRCLVFSASDVPELGLGMVISRLKKSTVTPQEVFVKCLEEYRQEDSEEWARQFLVRYRQRVAPTFLGEVYSHGHNAKHWAKQFVKERELGDFSEASDLIPAMAAIDPLILQDRAANVINSVALERLATKGYAIFQARRAVRSEKDWRRPKDAEKDWRSKVDFVIWRRLDPSRLHDDEQVFVNRHVEDEIRAEMDRDAQLLKARQKLEESVDAPRTACDTRLDFVLCLPFVFSALRRSPYKRLCRGLWPLRAELVLLDRCIEAAIVNVVRSKVLFFKKYHQ